jgi:hypothetical protein
MLYMEGERYTISDAEINDHSLKRAQPFVAPSEFNLSAYLKYGQNNRLKINTGKPGDVQIARLDLFPLND